MDMELTEQDVALITKNIELPAWVVEEFGEKAKTQNNKWKPYVEFFLTREAEYMRAERLSPKKNKKRDDSWRTNGTYIK